MDDNARDFTTDVVPLEAADSPFFSGPTEFFVEEGSLLVTPETLVIENTADEPIRTIAFVTDSTDAPDPTSFTFAEGVLTATGAEFRLVFTDFPDFENPADTDGNNVYAFELEVGVGDNPAPEDLQTIPFTVTVTDRDESPVVVLDSLANLDFNTSAALASSLATTIDLSDRYDDPLTTGLTARFTLSDPSLGSGSIDVLLFDQEGRGAPLSTQNFADFSDDYTNSIIHRSATNFVIQGGRNVVGDDFTGFAPNANGALDLDLIIEPGTEQPILNEFNVERSNTRGTIAYARQGGNINSATSQFFFNLNDSNVGLDTVDAGFTVFGEVLSAADLATLDAIAAQPVPFQQGSTPPANLSGALGELPVISEASGAEISFDDIDSAADFVRFESIEVLPDLLPEIREFSVASDNPEIQASLDGDSLVLSYDAETQGIANISVTAVTQLGESLTETFPFVTSPSFIAVEQPPQDVIAVVVDENVTTSNVADLDPIFGTIPLLASIPGSEDLEITIADVASSNEDLVAASLANGELQLELQAGAIGEATVSVAATALDGTDSLSADFTVSIRADPSEPLPLTTQQVTDAVSASLGTASGTANLLASDAFASIASSAAGSELLTGLNAAIAGASETALAGLQAALDLDSIGDAVFLA